jgi:hypothetical protein
MVPNEDAGDESPSSRDSEVGGDSEDTSALPTKRQTKECPFCAEEILSNARKCKHCGEFLDRRAAPASPPNRYPSHDRGARRRRGRAGYGSELARGLLATKSYVGPAFLTMVLYWLGYLPGLIANLLFLSSAKRDERVCGAPMAGKGCLTFLLVIHLIVPAVLIFLLLSGIGLFFSSSSERPKPVRRRPTRTSAPAARPPARFPSAPRVTPPPVAKAPKPAPLSLRKKLAGTTWLSSDGNEQITFLTESGNLKEKLLPSRFSVITKVRYIGGDTIESQSVPQLDLWDKVRIEIRGDELVWTDIKEGKSRRYKRKP